MTPPSSASVLILEDLTVCYGRDCVCANVSFSVPEGSTHAVLGRSGAGKSSLLHCVLGQRKPSAGRALIMGQDSWKHRRALRRVLQAITPETQVRPSLTVDRLAKRGQRHASVWDETALQQRLVRLGVPQDRPFQSLSPWQRVAALLSLALASAPRLLVLDHVDLGSFESGRRALLRELQGAKLLGTSVLLATREPEDVDEVADSVSFLRAGRLVLNDDVAAVKSRFRRIRYRNEVTAERTEYGNELDLFDAVRVRVRGWGVEAIVSNFEDRSFERFRQIPGVIDAEASPLSLGEIFAAAAGEETRSGK
jgi:ABC-2 type transport system ATP-binding protein